MTTRRYLLDASGQQPAPFARWERSIAMLRMEAEHTAEHPSLQMLIQTANTSAVAVEVCGKIPPQAETERLFLEAAAEALTNAVRHADARRLSIAFSETDSQYQVTFQNDGRVPENRITEGGGLSSLRRKIEMAGGTMCITCQGQYTLTLSVPKQGGETL